MCFVDAVDDRSNPSTSRPALPTKSASGGSTASAGNAGSGPSVVAPVPAPPAQVITAADFEDVRHVSSHTHPLHIIEKTEALYKG